MSQISLFEMRDILTKPYELCMLEVASQIEEHLATSQSLSISIMRNWMTNAFQGSDASGYWNWKDATDAQEAGLVLLLKSQSAQMLGSPPEVMHHLATIEKLGLTHSVRTEESVNLQQFSTPIQLGYLVALCGQINKMDIILEPSAGTGILARWGNLFGGQLILNELDQRRALLLKKLFPGQTVYSYDAEQIHDYLSPEIQPSVVLMNPPFSSSPALKQRNPFAIAHHIRSALLRLRPGGRLVLIAAHWFEPGSPTWSECFKQLEKVQVRFNARIDGHAYNKHGVNFDTRLLVIDKVEEDGIKGIETELIIRTTTVNHNGKTVKVKTFDSEEIAKIAEIPKRAIPEARVEKSYNLISIQPAKAKSPKSKTVNNSLPIQPLVRYSEPVKYHPIEKVIQTVDTGDTLYEVYSPKRIKIEQAHTHPSLLCESIALASTNPPIPSYQPWLPPDLIERGILSEAQIETIIYAGEAHQHYLSGKYLVDDDLEEITLTTKDNASGVQFRRGYMIGDGTGAGKGRQAAGCILDSFCHGETQAMWISKSEKLIEDARRDWAALGGNEADIVGLSEFKQGTEITLEGKILFTTYATLRSPEKPDKDSRLTQVLKWLGRKFSGVIVLDEAHCLGNAAGAKGSGTKRSLQGVAGLKLQNAVPDARFLYVSATGASRVSNLAYAPRLGLWGTGDFPFRDQPDFVAKVEEGGVAAMEVVCRDLKALGLYTSRNLSFEGVEYNLLEIELTPQQIEIYDAYANAFQIIHQNLEQALQISNISNSKGKALNSQAKQVAFSLFESLKQRFFSLTLTSMKCPGLIRAIEKDLEEGYAVVVQLVATNEELMKRQLAKIPVEEWDDLPINITPREYLMGYLINAFPVQLYEKYSGKDGEIKSRLVKDEDGNPVVCRELVEQRDRLVEQICALPAMTGALDQLLHHFGEQIVAEVTGRKHRILKEQSTERLYVSSRPGASNSTEVEAFQNDTKQILIFSDAGGTGRSYHSDVNCLNTRRRKHYGLEFGWKAENAIQGLGRTNRSAQMSAPIFCPVTTNVKGERRFISTIARRLNTLGALTKGERQTGGQGLFKDRDNLESIYAAAALKTFFSHMAQGMIKSCNLGQFETATGIKLLTEEGRLKDELPKMSTFLNRILALPIHLQNSLFEHFEQLIDANIEAAIASGQIDQGVATIHGEQLNLIGREIVYTHENGAQTECIEIERLERNRLRTIEEMMAMTQGQYFVNTKSHRACVCLRAPNTVNLDTGEITERVELLYPQDKSRIPLSEFEQSAWIETDLQQWKERWQIEAEKVPEFSSDRFFLICGLLLPIWNHLESGKVQVFCVTLSSQERFIGRIIDPEDLKKTTESLGLKEKQLSGKEIYKIVAETHKKVEICKNIYLKTSTVRGATRLEVIGSAIESKIGDRLKESGCFSEIIEWVRRYFVPFDPEKGPAIINAIQSLF